MSIPADPSVSDIVTEGLKRGGRTSPSGTDVTNFSTIQFQEVKSDIYLKSPRHESLKTLACIPVTTGISRYTWPTNAETIQSVQLIDAPTEGSWQAQAQAGGTATITLSASFSQNSADIIGKFIFLLGGTGANQFAQIIGYDDTTKIVTIEANWTALDSTWVIPDSTSIYLVENMRYKLWEIDKAHEWDTLQAPYQQMTPTNATMVARQIWLNTTPNRKYAMLITYWFALDQLDEASALFTGHLRKFRNIWTQGLATKVMQRYDEDRYVNEVQVYSAMLDLYGASASGVGQVQYRDLV